nr:unnamed protein product [Callosobruchus analis]
MDFFDKEDLAAILQKGLTIQEAIIDIACGETENSNECVEAVYIVPPDRTKLTDENSGDEDEGGDFDNLSKHQLLADAEIRVVVVVHSAGTKIMFYQRKILLPHTSHTRRFLTRREWVCGDFTYNTNPFLEPDFSILKDKSVVDLFVDDEIILFLVEETNKSALFKNLPDTGVSAAEMRNTDTQWLQ